MRATDLLPVSLTDISLPPQEFDRSHRMRPLFHCLQFNDDECVEPMLVAVMRVPPGDWPRIAIADTYVASSAQ